MGRRATTVLPRLEAVTANDSDRQSSARLDPLLGAIVCGRFHVRRVLARGGMGRVYYATQEPLGRPVALKVVRDDAATGAMRSDDRFLVEADILGRLQHPNIVTLYEYGQMEGAHRGQSFIAMELLGGETLAERIDGGRLAPAKVLAITAQIVRGLRAAHERGVVHRDRKPSNIQLVPEVDGTEIVKLLDFGIGKLLWGEESGSVGLTEVGSVLGTPGYLAPEQLDGKTSPAVDLYAVGAIMFLALTGRLPFDTGNVRDTLKNKLAFVAPRLRAVAPDLAIGDRLEALVASLLERDPEDRPSSAALAREIALCLREIEGDADRELDRDQQRELGREAEPGTRDLAVARGPRTDPPVARTSIAPAVSPEPGATASRRWRSTDLTRIVGGLMLLYALVLVYVFAPLAERPRGDIRATTIGAVAPEAPGRAAMLEAGAASALSSSDRSASALVVESVPAGATVSEGGRALGVTPLTLSIDRASAVPAPRHLLIEKSGFTSMAIDHDARRDGHDAHDEARVIVALARAHPATGEGRRTVAPAASPPAGAPAVPAPTATVQVFSTGN